MKKLSVTFVLEVNDTPLSEAVDVLERLTQVAGFVVADCDIPYVDDEPSPQPATVAAFEYVDYAYARLKDK